MKIQTTIIKFPDISLHSHYGHKLRGYFGNLFKEKSPLLHNHYESGKLRYSYPLVQYKIIDSIPLLLGINEGAELLIELFLKIKELKLEDKIFPIYSKNISNKITEIGISNDLIEYKFKTMWMGLNQNNFNKYNVIISEFLVASYKLFVYFKNKINREIRKISKHFYEENTTYNKSLNLSYLDNCINEYYNRYSFNYGC